MESARAAEGDDAFFRLYWYYGTRIHHDKEMYFDPADGLRAVGLDESHAAAFDDESWDKAIRVGMDEGLDLVGDDVGTPIIAITNSDGVKAGLLRTRHHEGAADRQERRHVGCARHDDGHRLVLRAEAHAHRSSGPGRAPA